MTKKRSKGKWVAAFFVLVAFVGAGYYYFNFYEGGATGTVNTSPVRTGRVIRGSISSIVSGSGSVATSREQELAAPGASTLLEIHVEDGDIVAKGDVMFVLDCPEVVSSQLAVSRYEYQLQEYYAARRELEMYAEREYMVTSLSVRSGEKLARNGAMMSLLDISSMSIQIPAQTGEGWAAGDVLQVTLLEYGNTVIGTLHGAPVMSRSNGMDYLTFTLLLDKGQRIDGETYGQAYNRTLNNQSAVMLRPNAETLLRSPADGHLDVLNAVEGKLIPAGALIYRISSTSLDSQISDANSEMQLAMANLKQKQTVLRADFDGIYYAAADSTGPKNTFLQVGDSLRSNESLGKVVDSDRMQIVFNVDELDIAKVEIGQEVNIVADALPDRVYTGRVARIAQEGASSGNVAYYWVLIEVTDWAGLKVGMTTSLEIVVEESHDTLLVPINAVHTLRGIRYVILAEDQTGAGGGTAVISGDRSGQVDGATRVWTGGDGQPMQYGQGAPDGQPVQRRLSGDGQPMQPGQFEQRGLSGDSVSMLQEQANSEDQEQPVQSVPDSRQEQPGQSVPDSRQEQSGQQVQRSQSFEGLTAGIQLPERAVIVQTGIINDTFVEILSGLEEGQVVELSGTPASGMGNPNFMMMPAMGGMGGVMSVTVMDSGPSGVRRN